MLIVKLRAIRIAVAVSLGATAPAASVAVRTPSASGTPPSRAYVLMIHGGAWHRVGPRAVAGMAVNRPRLRSWGYVTELVRYRPLRRAFPDVLAAYDRLRRRVGPHTPICAYGASAGAQMALMLAILRPDVACVIAHAAPTELPTLSPHLRARARAAFGGRLIRWSPASYRLLTPTLLEQASDDGVVPFAQMALMHDAAPHSRTLALAPGTAPWVHARVDPRALANSYRVERRFMRAAIAHWRTSGPFGRAVFLGPA